MGILNYTTTVPVLRTSGQIGERLAKHGAMSVLTRYAEGRPAAIGFAIDTEFGERAYDLPVNTDGVYKALSRDGEVPPRYKNREQAERVAWRILKDWIEAQVALIEAGMASLDTVMLPYMLTGSGRTLAVAYRESAGLRRAIDPPSNSPAEASRGATPNTASYAPAADPCRTRSARLARGAFTVRRPNTSSSATSWTGNADRRAEASDD